MAIVVGGSTGAPLSQDSSDRLNVVPTALAAGTNNIGDVDVLTMPRGTVATAHSAITATATSAEVDCRGYNALIMECAVSAITSGNWVCEAQGSFTTGGTLGSIFTPDGATAAAWRKQTSPGSGTSFMNANGNYIFVFRGVPDYVKIVATRTTDGTLTCKVQPANL